MALLFTVFAVATVAWLTYWAIVRPVVLDSIEDEIKRLKGEIDWAVIDGKDGAQSEAAQLLCEGFSDPSYVRSLCFSEILRAALFCRREIRIEAARHCDILDTAPKWIREIWHKEVRLNVKAALANSPTWWLPWAVISFVSAFSDQLEGWWTETTTAISKLRQQRPHAVA